MKKLAKYVICLVLTFLMVLGTVSEVCAAEETEKNTIAVVYDDSGSMMKSGDLVDRWCHAKYALEVFSTMMLEDDVMTVYPMNNTGATFTMKGSDSAEKRKQQVENFEVIYGSSTPYGSVSSAYSKLAAVNDDSTKWLVVITDGSFGGTTYTNVNNNFEEYAANGINVAYLRIYDNADASSTANDRSSKVINQPDKDIYVFEAMKSADTLDCVNEISNLIFKRQALSDYQGVLTSSGNSLTMNIDVPVSQLVVFAQGEDIQVGDIKGPKNVKKNSAIEVETPEVPDNTGNIAKEDMLVADGLGGVVATYSSSDSDPLPAGTYILDISDTSNVEVYCKLAVDVDVKITQNGKSTEGSDNIFIGDYEVEIILRDPITGDEIDSSAKLISDAEYDIKVTNTYTDENGNEQTEEKSFDDGSFTDSLLRGDATIEGKIKLGDSYTTFTEEYTVVEELSNLEIQYSCPDGGINFEELDLKNSGISVKILEDGEVLSKEKAENLEFVIETEKNLEFEVVQGSDPGTFIIYPMYKGSMDETDNGEIPFIMTATLNMDGQQISVQQEGVIDIYVNLVPLDMVITVPQIEGKDKYGYKISDLPYVAKGSSAGDAAVEGDFQYIIAECTIDGRSFTAEEWETVKIDAYFVNSETGEKLEASKFGVKCEKGTGENISKILITPVSHVKNNNFYLFAKDMTLEVLFSYEYLGVNCKDTGRADVRIDTIGLGLVIFWGPILVIIAAVLIFIWSMTYGKCWNKPDPEFVIKRWHFKTGDSPEKVKSGKVYIHSYLSLLPRKPVIWRISSSDGMPAVILQATEGGYQILNPADLLRRNVQKNALPINGTPKTINVTNTTKLSVRTQDTPKEKSDTVLYLHKRKRSKKKK